MPYIVDVPISEGRFSVKAHSRPSHAQMQAITRSARKRAKEENIEAILVDNLLTLCEGWDVTDEAGSPIPWSREGLESAPNDILMELSDKLEQYVNRGTTVDARLRAIADDMDEDDPRREKLLELVDAGN